MEVVDRIRFLLPSRLVEILAEVTLLIEQPNADQRHAQIAGGLQVVAGQNAQAAGEDRKTFGQAEFGREVCDQGDIARTWVRRNQVPSASR